MNHGAAREQLFDHILVIMFENQYREYVLANDYFRSLASKGIDLTQACGVMHPSQTNYIASIAGELCNVTDDERPPPLPQPTIVDLLEAAGLSWKAYMDGYTPALCPWSEGMAPADQYPYVIKHNPFSSFASIIGSSERWAKVVDQHQLWVDLAAGTLPAFSWFTPDMWNDGHYIRGTTTSPAARAPELVDQAAWWLEWFFGTLRFPGPDSLFPPRTLVVVTFDEADFEAAWDPSDTYKYTYDGPNQVYTVLLGDTIEPGSREGAHNHYSVLRTIEENFGLGSLGKNDADSTWLRFLWGERFGWSAPGDTPITTDGPLAAAGYGDRLLAVSGNRGVLRSWSFDGAWSAPEPVGHQAVGQEEIDAVALAAGGGDVTLVYAAAGDRLVATTYDAAAGWSSNSVCVAEGATGAFALAACNRGADLMLVSRAADGQIWSRRRSASGWGEPVATGHSTDGRLTLGALGHTLLLVFEADSGVMMGVTYNTAPYNVTTIEDGEYSGPYDDAVQDRWSPSAHEVGHFAAASTPITPGEREPDLEPYTTGGAMVMAELDGVVHLAHPVGVSPDGDAATGRLPVVTEQFSIAGLLTPANPVSYRTSDETTTSNGYGTLAEVGWTPGELDGVELRDGGALAAAATDAFVALLFQPGDGGEVQMVTGRYTPA